MAGWTDVVVHNELVLYKDSDAPRKEGIYYRIKVSELAQANLTPCFYVAIFDPVIKHGKQKSARVEVSVWPGTEPLAPGRFMKEKPAKIEIAIERPGMKFPLVAKLGVQTANIRDFRNEVAFPLPGYREREEEHWKVSATFQCFHFKT